MCKNVVASIVLTQVGVSIGSLVSNTIVALRVLRKPDKRKWRYSPTHIRAEAALLSCFYQLLL